MRILISIGCNIYEYAQPLNGAEADARRMYEALIRTDVGEYDPVHSKLLLSPSVDEVRKVLRDVLFSKERIDTFTFFFAGHGGVRTGSFYMWLRDTSYEAQSISALPLSDLFRSINEVSPAQSNIIIDACESGGLVTDLGVLLKSDLLGDAGTPGITLVATSAQDQYSEETESGGCGTNAILDCIEGRDFVQDSASALDLVEIGRRLSTRLRTTPQNPVVWGLNLYGPPRFCRNPYYATDPAKPLRIAMQTWPSASDTSVREHYEKLWKVYADVSDKWNPRAFCNLVTSVSLPLANTPEVLAGFVERFGAAVLERAELSNDTFRRAEVVASLAVCLLQDIDKEKVSSVFRRFLEATCTELLAAGSQLISDLNEDRYALLDKQGAGLSELFYLPVRVSKVLGWISSIHWLIQENDNRRLEADAMFADILRLMLTYYSHSILTISDAQAPYWAVTLPRAHSLGLTAEAETLTGLLFNSFVTCKGQLARCDMPPAKVLDYLLARHENDFKENADLVQRPNITLTILIKAATALDLNEVLDESLWEIDGVGLTAYITPEFSQYGADMMSGGQNLVWTIGHEVFRVTDLVNSWPNSSPYPKNNLEKAGAVLASLLFPDRIPWFCMDQNNTHQPQYDEIAEI